MSWNDTATFGKSKRLYLLTLLEMVDVDMVQLFLDRRGDADTKSTGKVFME